MNTIALVFFTLNIYNPSVYTGPQISDKLFETHVECAEFVNTVAQGEVVDENFEFQFASIDGLMFKGGCYTTEQYKNLLDKLGI